MDARILAKVFLVMSKVELKNSWLRFLELQGYTHAVTFKPNDVHGFAGLDALHRLFVKVHMLVDRRVLGSRYARPSRAHLRSQAIGIVEGLPTCGHLHGAFKVHPQNWSKFEALFADGTTASASRKGTSSAMNIPRKSPLRGAPTLRSFTL